MTEKIDANHSDKENELGFDSDPYVKLSKRMVGFVFSVVLIGTIVTLLAFHDLPFVLMLVMPPIGLALIIITVRNKWSIGSIVAVIIIGINISFIVFFTNKVTVVSYIMWGVIGVCLFTLGIWLATIIARKSGSSYFIAGLVSYIPASILIVILVDKVFRLRFGSDLLMLSLSFGIAAGISILVYKISKRLFKSRSSNVENSKVLSK